MRPQKKWIIQKYVESKWRTGAAVQMAWLNVIILEVTKTLHDSIIFLIGNHRIIHILQSVVWTECNNTYVVLLKAQKMSHYFHNDESYYLTTKLPSQWPADVRNTLNFSFSISALPSSGTPAVPRPNPFGYLDLYLFITECIPQLLGI